MNHIRNIGKYYATLEQKQTYINYYFSNQDSMRCVVQKDTDEMLISNAKGLVLLPMAIQMPTVEFSITTKDLAQAFINYWIITLEK